ncbi:MAG: hybrid sensor histidine kinase/response regulator [Gammaproteobacteria bacterium]|nr:hybrid sensor histidine kinase/response regulator [Gammaproteobacteria bacterium]
MENSNELMNTFIEESHEHMPAIESGLLKLEKDPQDMEQINLLFRCVHTIKGGAGFLGLNNISSLAHVMEEVLSLARASRVLLASKHIDALLAGYDRLAQMLDEPRYSEETDINGECKALAALRTPLPADGAPKEKQEDPGTRSEYSEETRTDGRLYEIHLYLNKDLPKLETSFSRMMEELEKQGSIIESGFHIANRAIQEDGARGDLCFVFLFATNLPPDSVAEISGAPESRIIAGSLKDFAQKFPEKRKIPAAPESVENARATPALAKKASVPAQPPSPPTGTVQPEESIRVPVKRLNKLIDLAGELVLIRNQILRIGETAAVSGLKNILQDFNRVTTEMQEEIMNTRMQPVGIVFSKFPRLVRQLASELGKDIELITEGGDVELDKSIIESLSDPMTHIVRNTADHGIETPDERTRAGKSPGGTLVQKAFHESGQVIIQVSDDGRGIDAERIARNAVEKGIITQKAMQKMSDKEKINLVFAPGISTAKTVSAISGRGVGMDVVKSNIEQTGGVLDISSVLGEGTTLTMTLPLTVAILPCLIVEIKNRRFAFPQVNLEEMLMLQAKDYASKIGQVQGKAELRLRGKLLPFIPLEKGLSLDAETEAAGEEDRISEIDMHGEVMHILIVKSGAYRIGIIVDKILGGEEIVAKPMPEYLKHIKSFSGTAILGDGTIAMIIDIPGFVEKNRLSLPKQSVQDETGLSRFAHETESFLIFDNGTEEHFALALPWIRRVDTLKLTEIQRIGEREYLNYRGEQMRILRLENYMPIQSPPQNRKTAHIIIPKHARVPVGLLIGRVIDTKTMAVKLEKAKIEGIGIVGSTLLDGRITLVLDLYAILKAGEPESVSYAQAHEAKSKHVLLVEDTPFFMEVVKECLEMAEYQITTAVNGEDALNKLENQAFDLVLTDIEMPVMDGRELIKHIRAKHLWDGLPVIALTAVADKKVMEEGKKAGFTEWLVKLDKEVLLKTVSGHLH